MKPYIALTATLAIILTGCVTTTETPAVNNPALDALGAPNIVAFENDRAFKRYLKSVKKFGKPYDIWWASSSNNLLAQAECADPSVCEDEVIVTTGTRSSSSSSSPTSITNTQNFGVDEGDIVKQYKDYLIVLQDGRLFSVDTGARANDLALVDRINVYQDIDYDAWYDELLVFENLILVTGYSYEAEATELAVFEISETGTFTHRSTFYKSSDDYYDSDNYATRLVDDKLILYTPLDLTYVDPNERLEWPVIRRWTGVKDKGEPWSDGRDMFDARKIHYPIQRTVNPTLHTVSICPLDIKPEETLTCKTQAMVGPSDSEWYVSREAAFLWIAPNYDDLEFDNKSECESQLPPTFNQSQPSALYRFPLSGHAPTAMFTRGTPINQFSLESDGQSFKALVRWTETNCDADNDDKLQHLSYFKQSLKRFASTPPRADQSHYTDVPDFKGRGLENRFTDTHLIYAGRRQWWNNADTDKKDVQPATIIPDADPGNAVQINLPHSVIRAERLGDDFILTGHRKDEGLFVSMIKLDSNVRRSDTLLIDRRYESEGRSHAFNGVTYPDGSALMGLPTSQRVKDSRRNYWRSKGSDVSFMRARADGSLTHSGPVLGGGEDAVHPDYDCEMSCVDWYGNTRPVFLKGRVFALIGTELVEARMIGSQIKELSRIDISAPIGKTPVN